MGVATAGVMTPAFLPGWVRGAEGLPAPSNRITMGLIGRGISG